MKIISTLLISTALLSLFIFGYSANTTPLQSEVVEQIHLTCWDKTGESSIEKLRLVLDQSLRGLIWFSDYSGNPTGEGKLSPSNDLSQLKGSKLESERSVKITESAQSFAAVIPTFIFQPHVHTLQLKVKKDQVSTLLECHKINLQKRQSLNN